jgi:hypothetical protein
LRIGWKRIEKPEVMRVKASGLARKARCLLRPSMSKYAPLPFASANQTEEKAWPLFTNSAARTRPAPWFHGTGSPSAVRITASIPGSGTPDEPGLIGSMPRPYGLPKIGPAVSVCHIWSITGMRSCSTCFCSHSQAGAFSTSPAQNTRSSDERS